MPNVRISSGGHVSEYGAISDGVAYNVTSPDIYTVVQAIQVDGALAQTGSGSPEGVVTPRHANDLYYDTTAKHLYVHAAATGNTGWVDATAAAAPSGPTVLSSVGVDTASLVDGQILVWDATNKRFHSAPATAIANATDATSVIAQLNALLALLRTKNLIAP